MKELTNRNLKFVYFLLGVSLPLTGYFLWTRNDGKLFGSRKKHVDRAHDITVEDSFPASDPPSAW